MSYAVWYSDIARAHVTTARGIHFSTMGHSVSRANLTENEGTQKVHKRLELLPEEALYLVERGSLFCWKPVQAKPLGLEEIEGAPMTVQQAFTEMIGKEDLSLEKYQVSSLQALVTTFTHVISGLLLPSTSRLCRHKSGPSLERISCCCTVPHENCSHSETCINMDSNIRFFDLAIRTDRWSLLKTV